MKRYELNGLGEEWIFDAESEEEATSLLIIAVLGRHTTIEEYERYCEDVSTNPQIEWKEVK